MAVKVAVGGFVQRGIYSVTWTGLKSGASVGQWANLAATPDRTAIISGTWGPGATIILEGSNAPVSGLTSGTAGFALNDSRGFGNAISLTTGKAVQILENTLHIRPRITSLTSTTTPTLNVTIVGESRLR